MALFARRQPLAIRYKLAEVGSPLRLHCQRTSVQMQREHQSGKVTDGVFVERKLEMLLALRQLGDDLSPEERAFVEGQSSEAMANFERASNQLLSSEEVMAVAGTHN